MLKKGQLQISFGVIFSVIIIAATLAVAGYVIVKVINSQNDIDCKIYNLNLQNKINAAWGSDGSISNIFNEGSSVPGKTKKVCFGSVNQTLLNEKDKTVRDSIKNNVRNTINLMFYPINSCGENQFAFTLQHVKIDGFFCVDVAAGKAQVKYAKGVTDSLVKICPGSGNCSIGDSVVSDTTIISGIINGSA